MLFVYPPVPVARISSVSTVMEVVLRFSAQAVGISSTPLSDTHTHTHTHTIQGILQHFLNGAAARWMSYGCRDQSCGRLSCSCSSSSLFMASYSHKSSLFTPNQLMEMPPADFHQEHDGKYSQRNLVVKRLFVSVTYNSLSLSPHEVVDRAVCPEKS